MTIALDTVAFLATPGGGRKHLAQCPYLVGAAVVRLVEPAEQLEVCDWCGKELAGFGRTYFDDLDAALAAFKAPLANRRLIKDALRDVEHDQIWMPYSSSYIALGLGGRGVAWTGKTYVVPAPGFSIELPGYIATEAGTTVRRDERWGAPCSGCHEVRALNGSCGCD